MDNFRDITGSRHGKLVVVAPTTARNGKTVLWLCKCDCGNETLVPTDKLNNGHTKTCGCGKSAPRLSLEGSVFGRLTVISRDAKNTGGRYTWLCKCECGNLSHPRTDALTSGDAKSCGCLGHENSAKALLKSLTTHGLSGTREYKREKGSRRNRVKSKTPVRASLIISQVAELGGHCVYCGGPYEHIDHFIPLAKGGKHVIENLVPSCRHCNLTKSSKIPGASWWPQKWTASYQQGVT